MTPEGALLSSRMAHFSHVQPSPPSTCAFTCPQVGTGALHEYSVPTPLALAHVAYWRKIETYLSASSLVCIFLWALGQFSLRAWH